MWKRVLGRTGLEVSELAMGGLFVAGWFGDRERARDAIRCAVDRGVNYIDTAPGYGDSEEVVGYALRGLDASVIVSTKLGGRPQPFDPRDRRALLQSVDDSRKLLGRDVIDILMVHEPDRPGQYDWWEDAESYLGPVADVLDILKRDGVIRFTGLGGTTAYELPHIMATGRFDVVLTAFNYSLLWREAEQAVLPTARVHGMGVVAGSPLQQGALARRYDAEIDHGARWLSPPRRAQYQALYAALDEFGLSLPEAGLRLVLSNPLVSCTLMGARSVEEVEQNIAAVEKGPLPPDVLSRLDEIAARVPFRPFEEPFGLPFGRDYRGPGPAR